MPTGLIEML